MAAGEHYSRAARVAKLYLWFFCITRPAGLVSAEFDMAGSISVRGFTALHGFLNSGDASHLELSINGCPTGPVLASIQEVDDPIVVDATTWGRIKAQYR